MGDGWKRAIAAAKATRKDPPPRPLQPGERCGRLDGHPPEYAHEFKRFRSSGAQCKYVEPALRQKIASQL